MRPLSPMRRVTIVCESLLESMFVQALLELGAIAYTVIDCRGASEAAILRNPFAAGDCVRIAAIVQPAVADRIQEFLEIEIFPRYECSACFETVQVVRPEKF